MLRRCHALRAHREYCRTHWTPLARLVAQLGLETAGESAQRRSAQVISPEGAATTPAMAVIAGILVTVIAIDAKFAGSDRSTPGLGKIMRLL